MKQKAIEEVFAQTNKKRYEKNQLIILYVVTFFIFATLCFFALPNLKLSQPLDDLYLQMVIFLFATLVGFTISRQNSRYREIIEEITSFDGSISAMYREFAYFGTRFQEKFVGIAGRHYFPIVQKGKWDYNLVNKSATLQDTYSLVQEVADDHELSDLEKMSVSMIKKLLADMQKSRKDMIALHAERIQDFQWFVIYFLCIILMVAIASVSSYGLMLESILKAAFVTSIGATAVMLHKLDTLELFESFIGEKSAKDILDIFEGKK